MRLLGLLLLLAFAAGCSCGDADAVRELDPRLEIEGASPDPQATDGLLLDFGAVHVGGDARRRLTVRNRSNKEVELAPLHAEAPFGSDLGQPRVVPPRGTVEVELTFAPAQPGGAAATATLASRLGDRPLRLVGQGLESRLRCSPGALEFYAVVMGSVRTLPVVCSNDTGQTITLRVPAIGGTHGGSYRFVGYEAGDEIELEAGATLEIPVTFDPVEEGLQTASFRLTTADDRKLPEVQMRGWGQDGELLIYPQGLCLFPIATPMGASAVDLITVINRGPERRRITDIELPPGYTMNWSLPIVLPPDSPDDRAWDSIRRIEVTFTPPQIGPSDGIIRLHTDDPKLPFFDVCVSGFGGGPDLFCEEEAIDFGSVALGVPVRRSIACENRGAGPVDHDYAQLDFHSIGVSSPAFQVQLRDPAKRRYAPGERFFLDVTAEPESAGDHYAAIVLLTSDSSTMDERILLSASAEELPPCQYEIDPPALDFGAVEPGAPAVREVRIHNRGGDTCLLHDLRLGEGTDAAFQLDAPPAAGTRIEGGASLPVRIAFTSETERQRVEGRLVLQISDPEAPLFEVPLAAVAEPRCLELAADESSFGVVEPGCSSAREILVLNRCDAPVAVEALALQGADAGAFTLGTAAPLSIGAGEGRVIEVAFAPSVAGPVLATLEIGADGSLPYRVALRGEAGQGQQVDRWAPFERQPVDLLWVVDERPAAAALRAAAGAAADRFAAALAGFDLHVGVTSACGAVDGRLLPLDGADRVLDGAGLDALGARLAAGSCDDAFGRAAALRAITPPLRLSEDDAAHDEPADGNAGFFRPAAHLGVLFLADGADGEGPAASSFEAVKPGAGSAHALLGCAGGAGFQDWVQAAGGASFDACSGAAGDGVAALAQAVVDRLGHLPLGNVPADRDGDGALSSLELQLLVDGSPVEAQVPGGATRWRYDGESGAIHFLPGHVPADEASIEVRYWPRCQ